jgi:hypothetical protein
MKRLNPTLALAALTLTLASVVALSVFPLVSDDVFRRPVDSLRAVDKHGVEVLLLMQPQLMKSERLPPIINARLYPDRNPQKSPYRTESSRKPVYWDNRYVHYLKKFSHFHRLVESILYLNADLVMTDCYFLGMQKDHERAMLERELAKRSLSGLLSPPIWRRLERPMK